VESRRTSASQNSPARHDATSAGGSAWPPPSTRWRSARPVLSRRAPLSAALRAGSAVHRGDVIGAPPPRLPLHSSLPPLSAAAVLPLVAHEAAAPRSSGRNSVLGAAASALRAALPPPAARRIDDVGRSEYSSSARESSFAESDGAMRGLRSTDVDRLTGAPAERHALGGAASDSSTDRCHSRAARISAAVVRVLVGSLARGVVPVATRRGDAAALGPFLDAAVRRGLTLVVELPCGALRGRVVAVRDAVGGAGS